MHARVSTGTVRHQHEPVVLIHGWGVSSSYFIPTAERLARNLAVFAPDLPGHGRSEALAPTPTVEDLAGIALEWMDAAGLERASVLGHSMGCDVAIEMALRDPGRISRLILVAPTPDPHARSVPVQFGRLVMGAFYERLSLIPHLVKDYLRMAKRLVPEFFSMLFYPIEKNLPRVVAPTLLARGKSDPVVPQHWLEEAALLVGTDRVLTIPRWGHAVQYSAAPQLVDGIEPFLSGDLARIT
jgi:2-hydroxy-6-oxonona-2,4-dienedioate hydrolase